MATYKTEQGDTWDLIALRVYDDEHFMDVLIKANIEHRKTVIFQSGGFIKGKVAFNLLGVTVTTVRQVVNYH